MKNLGRTEICQNEGICVVQPSLTYRLEGVNGPIPEEEDDFLDQLLRAQKQQDDAEVTVEFATKAGGQDREPTEEEVPLPEIRKSRGKSFMA
jgi:hypothetical protein